MKLALVIAAGAALLAGTGPASAQALKLTGPGGAAVALDAKALAAMPHQTLTVAQRGRDVRYDGVPVSALTALVGAPQGEALRGPALASVLIVTASDGYRVALSLAETDAAVRPEQVIVADRADGQPLDAHDGPLRLVIEGDKRPARWARDIRSIEVRPLP